MKKKAKRKRAKPAAPVRFTDAQIDALSELRSGIIDILTGARAHRQWIHFENLATQLEFLLRNKYVTPKIVSGVLAGSRPDGMSDRLFSARINRMLDCRGRRKA